MACSPQISPHDLIVLSGLESFALGYEVPPTSGQKKLKRHKIITIDTRPHEEYPPLIAACVGVVSVVPCSLTGMLTERIFVIIPLSHDQS